MKTMIALPAMSTMLTPFVMRIAKETKQSATFIIHIK